MLKEVSGGFLPGNKVFLRGPEFKSKQQAALTSESREGGREGGGGEGTVGPGQSGLSVAARHFLYLPKIFGKIVKLSSAIIQQLVPAKQFDWLRDIKNVMSRRDIYI